jgi:3-dehydroquinate dehydratase I
MITHRPVKGSRDVRQRTGRPARKGSGPIVGVIASRADLRAAARMRHPPDLFELRLDCLCGMDDEIADKAAALRSPLVVTARHPLEGGANDLGGEKRRNLLYRFLPHARFIDVELRSLPAFRRLLHLARKKGVRPVVSFHDLKSTPTLRTLRAKARRAKKFGAAVFKVATRTDTAAQLGRLVDFFEHTGVDIAVSAMGIGRFGAVSRLLLAKKGSALNYVSLRQSRVEGQLSVQQLRSALSESSVATGTGPRRARKG